MVWCGNVVEGCGRSKDKGVVVLWGGGTWGASSLSGEEFCQQEQERSRGWVLWAPGRRNMVPALGEGIHTENMSAVWFHVSC